MASARRSKDRRIDGHVCCGRRGKDFRCSKGKRALGRRLHATSKYHRTSPVKLHAAACGGLPK